jgi:hypothetical protein
VAAVPEELLPEELLEDESDDELLLVEAVSDTVDVVRLSVR